MLPQKILIYFLGYFLPPNIKTADVEVQIDRYRYRYVTVHTSSTVAVMNFTIRILPSPSQVKYNIT